MKKIFALSLFLFISVFEIQAQETIDLNEAIKDAIKNNTNVSNLEKSLEIQQLSTSSARGDLFPDLNLTAGWTRNNTFSEGTVRFVNGVPTIIPKQNSWINNFNVGVNTSVVLFNGFANYTQVKLSQANEMAVRIDLEKEKYDIAFRINSAYFDVLKKEKIVVANEENLADSKRTLESIKEFMNVGKRTIADVYRQDVQVAQNELALERSKNDLDKSKIDLLLAINTDLNKQYAVSDNTIKTDLTEADLKAVLDKNANTEMLVNTALQRRYDYQSSLQIVRINEVQLSIDKKNLYFPTLSATSNYNLNASRINGLQDSRSFTFGFLLSYPIFQGFSLDNKRQTSEIVIKQRQEDVKQLEQQIRSDIKKSYLDIETQYKQIEILNRNIVSAEQDRLLSEENYRVGLGTILEVQTAATKLNSLKIDLINAYYDFLLAEKRINYYSGELSY
ncbi:MAG: TolC family protein [Ignavibacteria bacterium]